MILHSTQVASEGSIKTPFSLRASKKLGELDILLALPEKVFLILFLLQHERSPHVLVLK